MSDRQTDVIVIGSGIGGLSCAALLARYGFEVTVCESHSIPGGAAHAFERNGFKFDSGSSLYSGLSYSPSGNPLRPTSVGRYWRETAVCELRYMGLLSAGRGF